MYLPSIRLAFSICSIISSCAFAMSAASSPSESSSLYLICSDVSCLADIRRWEIPLWLVSSGPRSFEVTAAGLDVSVPCRLRLCVGDSEL